MNLSLWNFKTALVILALPHKFQSHFVELKNDFVIFLKFNGILRKVIKGGYNRWFSEGFREDKDSSDNFSRSRFRVLVSTLFFFSFGCCKLFPRSR